MLNENYGKPLKKPVPLPRKSLLKSSKVLSKVPENDVEEKESTDKKSDGRKSAPETFVSEKKKMMRNEVNKLEKSMRTLISRRKSSNAKANDNSVGDSNESSSVSDGSVFLNISFTSPLKIDENHAKDDYDGSRDDDSYESQSAQFMDDDLLSNKSLSPPAYPPPAPPDESLYDQMRNIDFTELHSCKSISNDCSCGYSTTSSSKSFGSESIDSIRRDFDQDHKEPKGISTVFYQHSDYDDNDVNRKDDRYQIIYESVNENNRKDFHTVLDSMLLSGKNKSEDDSDQSQKSIIDMFDPLQSQGLCMNSVNIGIKPCKNSLMSSSSTLLMDTLAVNSSRKINSESELLSSITCDIPIIPPNLHEGNYGKIQKVKKVPNEDLNLLPKNSVLEPPPIPPRPGIRLIPKIDVKQFEISLPEPKDKSEYKAELKAETFDCNSSFSSEPVEEKSKSLDVGQWSSLKRVAKKVADNIEQRTSYLSLKKPSKQPNSEEQSSRRKTSYNVGDICVLPQNFPKHSGIMYKAGGIERWGVLSQRKLTLFANKDSPDVKETVPMDSILSIQATQNKISSENMGVHCFEISLSSKSQLLLFGVPSISERHIWMRKLLESIGPGFSAKLSMDYSKAGWCYAKESISCDWTKHCILLHHRTLFLSSENGVISEFNLRKARNISLRTDGFTCESVTEKGPQIVVDLQERTLYLQMDHERETKAWESSLMEAALKNGPSLSEQQLTKDDVPAIVEKCLNFVHTHGCFSEGIYRRSGSNRTVSQLLAAFRFNAWSVQLNRNECTEFDVSSVLKRFFRDLPEPLLVPEIQRELGRILDIKDTNEKTEQYKTALRNLPIINYLTARRLLGHLYFVNKQKEKNLMGAENLAAIWGPTILQVQEQVSLDSDCFKMETLIVNDLICHFPEVFNVEKAEVEKEMKILKMLENYHANNSNNTLTKKPSGELKIWVYLHSPNNSDDCYNISINPQKTAEEVCQELSFKANEPAHVLCLEEVICSGHLIRPLNHSEKVLDTVLRWSYWDENDRKDNCLVLKKNDLFQQVAHYAKYPVIVSEELKFADQKTKTFKTCQIEFSQAKLNCYKDKLCSQKIAEWNVEDIVWYFGHEPKRTVHSKWSITFIERHCIGPRTKERPYFGNTICGSTEEQKMKLATAMLMGQYSKGILPSPNLME